MVDDTLKTTVTGMSSATVVGMGWLPDVKSVVVGVTTMIYLIMKIRKDFRN